MHTLSVQVVLDGNGVVLLGADGLLLALGVDQRVPVPGVLLFEVLDLLMHRECFLFV